MIVLLIGCCLSLMLATDADSEAGCFVTLAMFVLGILILSQ